MYNEPSSKALSPLQLYHLINHEDNYLISLGSVSPFIKHNNRCISCYFNKNYMSSMPLPSCKVDVIIHIPQLRKQS